LQVPIKRLYDVKIMAAFTCAESQTKRDTPESVGTLNVSVPSAIRWKSKFIIFDIDSIIFCTH